MTDKPVSESTKWMPGICLGIVVGAILGWLLGYVALFAMYGGLPV